MNLGKKPDKDVEKSAFEEAIEAAEQDDDAKAAAKKPSGPAGKKLAAAVGFARGEKKRLIAIGAMLIGWLMIFGIGNVIVGHKDDESSLLNGSLTQLNKEYNKLLNEMDQFQKTNPYYTGVNVDETDGQKDVSINWIGVKYDAGKASSDSQFFWDWISPAFEYDSAAEYNKNVAEFTASKGLSEDNLFVTSFLRHYDYTSVENADANDDGKATPAEIELANRNYKGYSDKSVYSEWVRLIGTTESGDYHYMAMVPFTTSSSGKYYTMVMFTFTVKHTVNPTTGSDTMSVTDFNVWPPDGRNPTLIER